ncbi:MAG TPA: cache domain-containing protein, partial [Chitinophagaceae bacterium]|nr:cache domain-containing protein [Chitinophagaceae bacterium]
NLQQRNFRTLQHVDENIHKKIDNSTNLLDNILKAYIDLPDSDKPKISKYVDSFPEDNFKLFKPSDTIKGGKGFKRPKAPAGASIIASEEGETRQILKVDNDVEQFNLKVFRVNDDDTSSIALRYKFKQFIEPLLPKKAFDQYIIFSKNRVVYETFPSGLSYSKKDSLLNMRNGVASAVIRNQEISGMDYRMFLQPVGFDSSNEWIIAGLVTESRYQLEKNKVPPGTVLLLITIALGIVLAFPWIKIYMVGYNDRLTFRDYVSCLLVSMLIIGIAFFVLFRYNTSTRYDDTPNAKENLAASIKKSFTAEVTDAYKELNAYDSLFTADKRFRNDMQNLDSISKLTVGDPYKSTPYHDTVIANKIDIVRKCCASVNINQVYWLNNNGEEIYNWDKRFMNGPHGKFDTRGYFLNAKNNTTYSLNGDTARKLYIEPVMSWSTGAFRTVISKRSAISGLPGNDSGIAVAALSLNIKSLDNAVMPGGYGFAVIDNSGKVMYHSDKYRNLNENLTEEFTENDELKSCLVAHSKKAFRTEYGGKKCAVLVQPLQNLPYFIVIFSDLDYLNTREIEAFSFTASMMTMFFLFLVAELLIVLVASSRRSIYSSSTASSVQPIPASTGPTWLRSWGPSVTLGSLTTPMVWIYPS